ncbi:hypothetical protein MRB53_013790 [Persea americana]|uniref:Uncharacterized protein n=1 Tax=Persea americana TaxID=3435 RepID=A0ACC2K8Y6_PERAE|nr:hypothetical protein MRB53_013790 [Persea americana]
MTRETTPLSFATLVCRGGDVVVKSVAAKVMWSVALESRSQAPRSTSQEEVTKPEPKLPILETGPTSWEDSAWGIKERWGSTDTTATLPVFTSAPAESFFFFACNSYLQSR